MYIINGYIFFFVGGGIFWKFPRRHQPTLRHCCSCCSAVNAGGTNRAHSFRSFKSSDKMRWMMVFGIPILSAIILQLIRWPSFKTAATRAMFSFVFIVPGLRLHFASSIDYSPATNWLCHRNTIARDMDKSLNTYTNISQIFTAVNPTLQQNFIAARCSKFFSMVLYNRSTEHTILQNALILRI